MGQAVFTFGGCKWSEQLEESFEEMTEAELTLALTRATSLAQGTCHLH